MSTDFANQLETLSERIKKTLNSIKTEEATKMSFIIPFFQILEYDVYDPTEFIPEFTADIGIKKGEKVDYAIMLNDKPLILVEAKSCHEKLDRHAEQLLRYFGCTESKFGILTNGIIYRFYTDLEDKNVMDPTPFLIVDMMNLKESTVSQLSKFKKSNFDVNAILNSAEELKVLNKINTLLTQEFDNPSDNFVKYVLNEVYDGVKTQTVVDKYKPIVKKSFNNFITELMNSKIKTAFTPPVVEETIIIENEEIQDLQDVSKIFTSQEELDSFYIIKSILAEKSLSNRIIYKDTESYFGILFDNNIRKWICRLYLSDSRRAIVFNNSENTKKIYLDSLDDIYKYKNTLFEIVDNFIK
ncbi:MAG: type I restriction endonuclease [Lachnospirales bacterium]